MKKLILFIFVALLSVMAYAQAGTQTFSISAGAMFPLSDLADNNLADSSSGVAGTGYHIQVSYDYLLSDNFGLGVDVEFNSAKYSMSKINKYYENMLGDAKMEYVISNGWTMGGIYLRYYLRLPLGSKASWDIAPLIGAMGAYSPEYQITKTSIIPPGPNTPHTYYRQRSKAFSFAYGAETKLNFKTNNHGFFFEGRVIESKANFKQVTGTDYYGKPYNYPVKMNLLYITASMGYTYYF
jgi:hypothetical protein